MPKFFINKGDIDLSAGLVNVSGGDANHIKNALRLKPGDTLVFSEPESETEYECEILRFENKSAVVKILRSGAAETEPEYKATIFQAVPKGDGMELVIQKCVELGAHEIVPVITERTVVKPDKSSSAAKTERYNKIAEAAAKQSLRGITPKVKEFMTLDTAVKYSLPLGTRFFAHEKEKNVFIKDIVKKYAGENKTAGIFIGPEGGFSDGEARMLAGEGIFAASLGKRVLRAETAAFTALIIYLYVMEEGVDWKKSSCS